ncbi:acetyl-CoA carboxylase carboxyltransferase subunit alpha [bacterium]|nr:acetyl-CoA carboxylase carboxyltransferase subunit alpha [bacterium]
MREFVFDFEKPVVELERKIAEMRKLSEDDGVDISEEIVQLEEKAHTLRQEVFSSLTRWQKVQLARHPNRPYTLDYIAGMTERFQEIHGDRTFADDHAIVSGFGTIQGWNVAIIGHQKGRGTKQNLYRNFGMPHPEGYRKALRVMKLAEKFNRPVITLVDTPGAYPGLGAEERGQAEAIARNLFEMSRLQVPIITVVIGEGGSGGALALAVADKVIMFEYSIYSVISPEGCASILYRDAAMADRAAESLRLTAGDLKELGIADTILPEPTGGAHQDWETAIGAAKKAIVEALEDLNAYTVDELIDRRVAKFGDMGYFEDSEDEEQARA